MDRITATGKVDLEAWETALRAAVLAAGAHILSDLLRSLGSGRTDGPILCECGTRMESRGIRSKELLTLLGPVNYSRSRFQCPTCHRTRYPGDEALDIRDSTRSPGVRRMMARAGSQSTFKEGRDDLKIYAEAVRRGLEQAHQVVIFGDGAEWIRGIAEMHFPGATQIIDLYHAREHVSDLCKILFHPDENQVLHHRIRWWDDLDAGNIEKIVQEARTVLPDDPNACESAETQLTYLEKNRIRMRYADFRARHFFIGSGVVEAACKSVIGLRLKQSGMEWSVRGANSTAPCSPDASKTTGKIASPDLPPFQDADPKFTGTDRRETLPPKEHSRREMLQKPSDQGFDLRSGSHDIDHPVCQEKLGTLESAWQTLPDGLFDNSRTGKSDESARLCNNHIAQGCIAGGDSAHGRMSDDRNERDSRASQTGHGGAGFCHLHQGEHSLVHPSAPTPGGRDYNRPPHLQCTLHRTGDLFADHRPHTASEKSEVNRRKYNRIST